MIYGLKESEFGGPLLPYQFDISIFKDLTNKDLAEHIKRKGIIIYSKVNENRA